MAPAAVTPVTLDTADMQGLVARAYGHLPVARYLLLGIEDPAGARRWLSELAGAVETAASGRSQDPCVNVAFTWSGLRRLGLPDDALATFPRPLQEGMVTEHRSRILGDTGASAPENWRWGGPQRPDVHVLLMLFAKGVEELEAAHQERRSRFTAGGALAEVGDPIEGRLRDDAGTEHFGFADGISQPVIKGWPRATRSVHPPAPLPPPKWSEVNPGEVLLGCSDNYGKPSEGPTVAARSDEAGLPVASWTGSGRRHLGHSGTYLVFRQLAQDVAGFHRFARSEAAARGVDTASDPWLFPAKVVGRWPNGAPLALAPERDDQAPPASNDFGYHELDQDGRRCPLGAHVRRSNPRDSSPDHPNQALTSTKNHRILRRGRPYGLALKEPATQPGEEAWAERGLLFICLNADVERQFEFNQNTWLNNPFFAGLYGEVDPLVGTQPPGGGRFTVQTDPVRRVVRGVPDFVTVKGGGYFFLPGIRALRCLAALGG